jgi:hypothetical protein
MALNNLKMFWLFVLLIVTCNCEPEKMKKCCKNSEMLNLDTVSCVSKEKFRNVQNVNPNFPKVLPDFLFDIDGQPKKINNTLFADEDLSKGFPKCSKSKYLSLDSGSGYFLTRLGKILSLGGEFEPTRDIGDFCLDFGIGLNSANIRAETRLASRLVVLTTPVVSSSITFPPVASKLDDRFSRRPGNLFSKQIVDWHW